MVLFDLGAHFGLFSLAALHYGGIGSRAVAVDPSPAAMRMMRVEARLNNIADGRWRLVQAAVTNQVGVQQMVAAGVHSAGYYVAPSTIIPKPSALASSPLPLTLLHNEPA